MGRHEDRLENALCLIGRSEATIRAAFLGKAWLTCHGRDETSEVVAAAIGRRATAERTVVELDDVLYTWAKNGPRIIATAYEAEWQDLMA